MRLILADCLEALPKLEDCSVDAVVTDPPYGLVEPRSVHSFGHALKHGRTEEEKELRRGGFMGKKWDGSGIQYSVELWAECLRVLKPGGHLLAFGGTRTSHRLTCAIEDAGFQIRDSLMWIYGSG